MDQRLNAICANNTRLDNSSDNIYAWMFTHVNAFGKPMILCVCFISQSTFVITIKLEVIITPKKGMKLHCGCRETFTNEWYIKQVFDIELTHPDGSEKVTNGYLLVNILINAISIMILKRFKQISDH